MARAVFEECAGIGNVHGGASCLANGGCVPETGDDFARVEKVKV
jgi:hypothetical protein